MFKKIKKFLRVLLRVQQLKFYGKNNIVDYKKSVSFNTFKVKVYGNNNKILIDEKVHLNKISINIGFPNNPVNNSLIKIGENTGFQNVHIQVGEDDSFITIGKDCMCSFDLEINCTDHHAILDCNGALLNRGRSVEIGDNVWIGKEVRIMKNSKIPNGCVVAQRSVVTKKFEIENCVLAGNPAKIVKENIFWSKKRPNSFLSK